MDLFPLNVHTGSGPNQPVNECVTAGSVVGGQKAGK